MDEATLTQYVRKARLDKLRDRVMNRLEARLSGWARPITAFVSQPEPKTIGSYARGRQLMAGNFLFSGYLVEAKDSSIWDITRPNDAFDETLHGFGWLDDLAAVGDSGARELALRWFLQWVDRFGKGTGPGWKPELAGRRMIRWINHAIFLLNAQPADVSERYFRAVAQQTRFLSKRWHGANAGLPRFEALTGLIYAGISLEGYDRLASPASRAIAEECAQQIDPNGGIPSRNPEELLDVFTLLNWSASALSEAGLMPQRQHLLAIERIAPTLRALRHTDGGLARFHGGGRGLEGRLDQALAVSGVRATATSGLAMGYSRLSAGRTSVIVDTAAPPETRFSSNAHASTLAMELTSGRRPIIVNCGSGAEFGAEWRRAGRATPSHSTLSIEGYSSSRFVRHHAGLATEDDLLLEAPGDVRVQQSAGLEGATILATHDGYSQTHGLLHVRRLDLSINGRELSGEDTLGALSESNRIAFEQVLNENRLKGVRYAIRFHLHPDVDPTLDLGGAAASLALKSGELWVFRYDGPAVLSLEPSVYLEKGRLKPRATKQIVLSETILDYSSQIRWSLTRAQDGKTHIRDLAESDSLKVIR